MARYRYREPQGRTDRLTSTAPATPAASLDTVFLQVSVIGVTWPRVEVGLGVVMRALILVLYKKADGCSKGDAVLDPGLQMNEIFLVALLKKGL